MGGPKKSDVAEERQAYRGETALGQQLQQQSQESLARRQQYQAPLVNFLQSIIGGDSQSRLAAAAIPVGEISRGTAAARENILSTQPAGAGRDFALAGLRRDESAQKAGLLNQVYLNAFPTLANIGAGEGQVGLQQLGGGLRATEAGASGLGAINTRAAQTKAARLGVVGSIAGGLVGGATGGGIAKGLTGLFSRAPSGASSTVIPTPDISGGGYAGWTGLPSNSGYLTF